MTVEGAGVRADRSRLSGLKPAYPLRTHQQQALDAIDEAMKQGADRAWVVLPPGAGKTLVGVETARRRAATRGAKTVAFGPNTAIQSQWMAGWDELGDIEKASGTRDLDATFTALTYQSLATFRTDNEVDEEGGEHELLARLHPNGRALVDALRAEPELTIVLDECHHLLEVWGRLLQVVLEQLPQAFVLALTATPPDVLTPDEKRLVDDLFGPPLYTVSIPAVVREGDLAPFAELAWLTTPTPRENDWLETQAQRFLDLVHQLTDPEFGSIGFFRWLDQRFVEGVGTAVGWNRLARNEPELTDAALRMTQLDLLPIPPGARILERHRHKPTADDWVLLVDDWMRHHLTRTGAPEDDRVVEAVRRALPSVGYVWTRRGIRRGRSPVDRVLARSEAKTDAVVQIVDAEHRNLEHRLRMLVLCDHEYATAVLPADLSGVMSPQSGSAHLTLERLVDDPATKGLRPLLVTGQTVAGSPETLQALIDYVRAEDPQMAGGLVVSWPGAPVTTIYGPWRSRDWVPWVTRFFEQGHSQVLVGTRGLLGEGWDARAVTGLVDLTAATTPAAVVQTRGRALRTDPDWPDKVALTWTVVCVTEDHPKGGNDWERFCRKHRGFFGVDEDGEVVDGVAHVDSTFSPFASPPVDTFDAVNAAMLVRSEDRQGLRERWRVGEDYEDTQVHTLRVQPSSRRRLPQGADVAAPTVVATATGLEPRADQPAPWRPHPVMAVAIVVAALAFLLNLTPSAVIALGAVAGLVIQGVVAAHRGRSLLAEASRRPTVEQIGCAVADGLRDAGLSPRGADAVRVEVDSEGEYRCFLDGVPPEASRAFAVALDEVLSPMAAPRYVVPRHVLRRPAPGMGGYVDGLLVSVNRVRPIGEVWHSVPTVLGTNAKGARAFARGWEAWVGGGPALYTGHPEGEGVLVTHRGSDPFAVTTVLRTHWR